MNQLNSTGKSDSADRFVDHLAHTMIVSRDEISEVIEGLPPGDPLDARAVAKALVRSRKITKYQAQMAYQGKAASLKIGEYVVLDRIGEGGMGHVLKARHQTMDRLVALKLLHRKLLKSEAMIQRFLQEVRAVAQLNHPNIVTAYDAGQHKESYFLVLEYVEGQDLSTVLREEGKLSIADSISCALQAARGLAYAHQKGIVHRDIKPANLLLGSDGVVKILDMGLARMSHELGDGLTATGQVMGTVDYMPPEQARGIKNVDARADIYALGCTMYKTLTGQSLYQRDTIVSAVMAHQSAPIPSLLDERPDVPSALNDLFQHMVAKRPEERPATMSEVVAVLERLDSGGGTSSDLNASVSKPVDDNLTEFFAEIDKRDTTVAFDRTLTVSPVAEQTKTKKKQQGRAAALIAVSTLLSLALLIIAVFVLTRPPKTDPIPVEPPSPNASPIVAGSEPVSLLSRNLEKVSNFDRHVARCVLDTPNSILKIEMEDGAAVTIPPSTLPRHPLQRYYVTSIDTDLQPANLKEWACLSKLERLETMNFGNFGTMSDQDAADIAALRWPALRNLEFVSSREQDQATDAAVAYLATIEQLEELHLFGGDYSDEVFFHIAAMPNLTKLTIDNQTSNRFTPAGLARLRSHPKLEWLQFIYGHMDDRLFQEVVKFKNLKKITIRGTRVTSVGLEALKEAKSLTMLATFQGNYSAPEMKAIVANTPKLEELLIFTSSILNDEALREIAAHPSLKSLLIEGCESVTDAGLLSLANAEKLESLTLKDVALASRVSPDGVAALEKAKEKNKQAFAYYEIGEGVLESMLSRELDDVSDMDRHVARCVLESGGGVRVDGLEGDLIGKVEALPETFKVFDAAISSLHPRSRREWECFSQLSELRWLRVTGGVAVTDRDCEIIASLPWKNLQLLGLTSQMRPRSERMLTDAGIEWLSKMETLPSLALVGGNLTDASLGHLLNQKTLHALTLTEQAFTKDGYAQLATHPSLASLTIQQTRFGDEHLAAMASSRTLGHLRLEGTEVTSKGLAALRNMASLQTLYLRQYGYGDPEVAALSRARAAAHSALDGCGQADRQRHARHRLDQEPGRHRLVPLRQCDRRGIEASCGAAQPQNGSVSPRLPRPGRSLRKGSKT